jgi:hypothetical protein
MTKVAAEVFFVVNKFPEDGTFVPEHVGVVGNMKCVL